MKPEELQIGDWIQTDNTSFKVVGFDTSHGEVHSERWVYDLERCNPIPLTPEILENNGFENIPYAGIDCNEIWLLHDIAYYGKSFPLYTDDIMLRYSISEQCWYIFFNIGDMHSDFRTITNIFYVHELQHVLKLFKIDKKIEL